MEQSYAEANAKKKTTGSVIALKIILIILVILVFLASILISISTKINLLVLIGVAAIFGLIWYSVWNGNMYSVMDSLTLI